MAQLKDGSEGAIAPGPNKSTRSSVRRISERGEQKFQKIWEEQRSESEIVPLKFSPIFRPKSGEEQKNKKVKSKKKEGLHSNLVQFFVQSLEETH